jgi:hypothetical protein
MHLVVVFFNLVQERSSLCSQNQVLRKANTSVKMQSRALEIKIEQDKRTASRKLLTSASTQANAPKRTSAAASRVSMEKELEPRRPIMTP